MSEFRQNMATKDWVIIATERAKRPHDYIEPQRHLTTETQTFYDPTCPFCPGNEELELEIERLPAQAPGKPELSPINSRRFQQREK